MDTVISFVDADNTRPTLLQLHLINFLLRNAKLYIDEGVMLRHSKLVRSLKSKSLVGDTLKEFVLHLDFSRQANFLNYS
jgi:hypothetical protein